MQDSAPGSNSMNSRWTILITVLGAAALGVWLSNIVEVWTLTAIEIVLAATLLVSVLSQPSAEDKLGDRMYKANQRLAFSLWLLTFIGAFIAEFNDNPIFASFVHAYGNLGFYIAIMFSVILKDHRKTDRHESMLNQYSIVLFSLGLLGYFIVLQPSSTQDVIAHQQSAWLFTLLMNACLFVYLYAKSQSSYETQYKARFQWMALGFLALSVHQIFKLLGWQDSDVLLQRLVIGASTIVPFILFCIAVSAEKVGATAELLERKSRLPSSTLWLPMLLPLIAAVSVLIDSTLIELTVARASLLLLWIVVFTGIWIVKDAYQKRNLLATDSTKQIAASSDPELKSELEPKPEPETHKQIELAFPFPYVLLDEYGRIKQTNEPLLQLLDYQEEQLIGQRVAVLFDNNDTFARLLRSADNVLSMPNLVSQKQREVALKCHSNGSIPCYMSVSAQDEHSMVLGFVNIGPLKEAETQALTVKENFIANITHEFRTPLTIIQGALEEGVNAFGSEQLKKRYRAALKNTKRVLAMVEQLLTLSKFTSAPKLSKTKQPLSDIVAKTVELFAPICKQKNIHFEYFLIQRLWAEIHEDSLQQLLYNLLSNAYKYTDEGGEIWLEMKSEDSELSIIIRDTGAGFEADSAEELFARFSRADNESTANNFGVGIGLSLVNQLVTRHEWQLDVSSKVGVGSIFTIHIPLCDPIKNYEPKLRTVDFSNEEEVNEAQVEEKESVTGTNRSKLLIIEDNPDMQDYLEHLTAEDFEVELAGRGNEGIDKANQQVPDLIVCDLMLPDISGFDVVEQIKSQDSTSHIPILMLTAKAGIESKLEGLKRQVDDYLTKPFNQNELLLRLKNLLNTRANLQQIYKTQALRDLHISDVDHETDDATPENKFLGRLQVAVSNHYQDEQFAMQELADELALGERQLQRKVKALLNITPNEFIREFRLHKAKALLQDGTQVGLVAEQVGFSSQAYFTKCFKEWTGQTPSAFSHDSDSDSEG